MSTLRHCCRHPRASSPDLPNAHPVPSPTQDDGYDADAVPIRTPTETLLGSPSPSPDEPRPSCDTVVHYEPIPRSSSKLTDVNEDGAGQTVSKALKPERVSSLTIPRRRSHVRSQPTLSTTAAASDQYVKMSPSRIALRKRLEAITIIDDPKSPPSPKLEPARVVSIPEAAVPPHWRLDYKNSSSSFRRPVLRELSVNEHEKDVTGEEKHQASSTNATTGSREVQLDNNHQQVPVSFENERHTNKQAPTSPDIVESQTPWQRSRTVSEQYVMPGSYQSDSTAASVHLFDMMISQRVASSNSNILPYTELNVRRQRASTARSSSPSLPMGMSRYHRDRQSSSLQSPKLSSSVYTSSEEELASNRRNSMLLIEGLPERLRRLKISATSGDLYFTSAQHSQITVIPRSRFPTTLTDESKKRGSSSGEVHSNEAGVEREGSDEERLQRPPLRRSSTEPRLNRLKRGAPASFDGSGEWHLSPPARQPTGLLARQATGLEFRRPTGTLKPEDAASAWERALRYHAEEDRVRVGSISHEISRDDFKRRISRRRFTRTPSPLGDITEDPWSQQRGRETEPASGRVSPTQAEPDGVSPIRRRSPYQHVGGTASVRAPTGSVRPVEAWTRYPSHTMSERTESANERDNVIARDFAVSPTPQRQMSKKKSRSMTFGRKFLQKIGRFYTTRSSDIRRYNAGYRSSISMEGRLENPELEVPRRIFEPVLLYGPRARESPKSTDEPQPSREEAPAVPLTSSPEPYATEGSSSAVNSPSPEMSQVDWGRLYNDLVVRPRNTSTDEEIAPDEMAAQEPEDIERDRAGQAEVDALREAALKAADDCLRRSMDIERYPKRV
ncbi:MAG: hypothetical protein L6R40_002737 [Gallowayella cf. fulva]|nr:MAG: hypothetical protein L6R40_002737 [Xanthomendoza cf. fulva]